MAFTENSTVFGRPTRYVVIREAPNSSSKKVDELSIHDFAQITGDAVNGWYPVKFDSRKGIVVTGYVYSRYIQIVPPAEDTSTESTDKIDEVSSDEEIVSETPEEESVAEEVVTPEAEPKEEEAHEAVSENEHISKTVEDIQTRVDEQETKRIEREEKSAPKKGFFKAILSMFHR